MRCKYCGDNLELVNEDFYSSLDGSIIEAGYFKGRQSRRVCGAESRSKWAIAEHGGNNETLFTHEPMTETEVVIETLKRYE